MFYFRLLTPLFYVSGRYKTRAAAQERKIAAKFSAGKAAAEAKIAAKAAKALERATARNRKGIAVAKRLRTLVEENSMSDEEDKLSTTVKKIKSMKKPNTKEEVESSEEKDKKEESLEGNIQDQEEEEENSEGVHCSDDGDTKVWTVADFTDLIGTTHYDSDDDAVYKCTSVVEFVVEYGEKN